MSGKDLIQPVCNFIGGLFNFDFEKFVAGDLKAKSCGIISY